MTQPSDRARKAAEEWSDILNHRDSEYDGDPVADLAADFATFERETPGFAAVVEALDREITAWAFANDIDGAARNDLMRRIRNLTPAPPAREGLDADSLRMGPPPAGVASYWPDEHGVLQPTNEAARAALTNAAAKHPTGER